MNAYDQVLDPQYMDKKYPSEVNLSKDEIKKIVHDLKKQGWLEVPKKWADKDGGGGEYIQHDHFHVKVNPEKTGDLGDYELKTHRSAGNSLITLGSIDPKNEEAGSMLHPLLLNYGFPYKNGDTSKYVCRKKKNGEECEHTKYEYANGLCYPDDEVSLGMDVCGKKVLKSPQNKWGFYLEINREKKRIFVHFDHTRADKEEKRKKWLLTIEARNKGLQDLGEKYSLPFDEIENAAKAKFHKMVFIKYLEKREGGKYFISIDEAYFLEEFSFENYLKALENGEVMYEFRLHGNQERISKNHGTGFRMFPEDFPVIYGKKEEI